MSLLKNNPGEYIVFVTGSSLLVFANFVDSYLSLYMVVIGFSLDMWAFHMTMADLENAKQTIEKTKTTIGLHVVSLGNAMGKQAELIEMQKDFGDIGSEYRRLNEIKNNLKDAEHEMNSLHRKFFND